MLEDLHIRAVIHELLQCGLHRLGYIGIALLDGHCLLGHADILAKGFQRAFGLRHGLKTEHIGERLGDIDIEADRGLAVLRKEFRGSIRRVHADGELAVLGD